MLPITFKAEANLSDILTLLTIILSIIFAVRATRDVARTERKSNVHRLLDRWASESMAAHRALATKLLAERFVDSSTPIFVGDIFHQNTGRELGTYHSISTLSHFFADLNALWREGVLDDRLACAVFSRAIEFWLPYFALLDSRKDTNDASPRSANSNEYRKQFVLPLLQTLAEAQRRTRYKSPMPTNENDRNA